MDFIIVGQKDEDNYVIQDVRTGMGGKCCCTRYTLLQLVQKGYSISGVRVVNGKITKKDVVVCNVDGSVATRNNTFPSVDATKRSASTIEKGIKLSREEKKTLREASEKRVKTMKENKKEAKRLELEKENAEKERLAKVKKEEEKLKKLGKKVQTSKPFFVLTKMKEKAAEYDWSEELFYTVELYSPAAITKFCKGLLDGLYTSRDMNNNDARSLNRELKQRGSVKRQIVSKRHLQDYDFLVVADNKVIYDFEQLYEGYEFTAEFLGARKILGRLSTYHISEADLKNGIDFGTTVGGENNLSSVRSYFFHLGYRTY